MTLATFTPAVAPSPGTSRKPEIRLLKASFGDGYTSVSPDGLNHIRRTLDLRWDVLTRGQAETIEAFLEAHGGGTTPFLYTPPGAPAPVKFTCEAWQRTDNAAQLCAFTATFKQSFSLAS